MEMRDKKLTLVRGKVVIVGIDVGKVMDWARPIRPDGTAADKAFSFSHKRSGFNRLRQVIEEVRQREQATGVVAALEATGTYWKPLAWFLRETGYTVVLINTYHVKQEKEYSDNTPSKNDRKDCRIIAELAQRGNYLLPVFPEGTYAALRELTAAREQERRSRDSAAGRVEAWLAERFPEFETVFKNPLRMAATWVLRNCPTPAQVMALPFDELVAGLKGASRGRVGQKRAQTLLEMARESVGVPGAADTAQIRLSGYLDAAEASQKRLAALEERMVQALSKTEQGEILCSLPGISTVTAAAFLGEIGDPRMFSRGRQIVKLAGFQLATNSSGQHQGQTRIAKRGRRGLRHLAYMAALRVIVHSPEFKARYLHLLHDSGHNLRKPQAIVAIAAQLLRVLFAMVKHGEQYDPRQVGGAQMVARAVA